MSQAEINAKRSELFAREANGENVEAEFDALGRAQEIANGETFDSHGYVRNLL
jgi:hypothetical protein